MGDDLPFRAEDGRMALFVYFIPLLILFCVTGFVGPVLRPLGVVVPRRRTYFRCNLYDLHLYVEHC